MLARSVLTRAVLAAIVVAAPIASGQDAPKRPNYSGVETKPSPPPLERQLYRSVDEKGRVVYSDAPKAAGQKGAKISDGNVASPEARRQLEIDAQNRDREEHAERQAAQRRAMQIRQREAEEEMRKRRELEATDPQYFPRRVRVIPQQ